jgi:hypothetical protein
MMTDLNTPRKLPTIGEEVKFYGYIVGLSVGLWDAGTEQLDRHLYVMFEYNGERNVWIAPDDNLFGILSRYQSKRPGSERISTSTAITNSGSKNATAAGT